MTRKRRFYVWMAAAAALSALAFTPVVIPPGLIEPVLYGIPRTLWAGVLITIGLVVLTYFAGRDAPGDDEIGGRR